MIEKVVCDLFNVAVAFGLNNLKLDSAAKTACGNRACASIFKIIAFCFAFALFINRIKTFFYFFFYALSDYFFFK